MPYLIYILLGNWHLSGPGISEPCGAPQLTCGVLGPCVVHERAGSQLDPGQVFEPVTAAMGWIELDVEVGLRPLAAVGRGLVHRHHVRRREPEVPVVSTVTPRRARARSARSPASRSAIEATWRRG